MPLWLTIISIIYGLGFVAFMVAVFIEAPKYSAEIGLAHFIVAIVWPVWIIWYLFAVVSDKIEVRRKRRQNATN